MGWIITGVDRDGITLFWNNENGWGEGLEWATVFSDEEQQLLPALPILLGRAKGGEPKWRRQ
jgi:hypothetical protein